MSVASCWNAGAPAGRIAYVNGRYLPLAHAMVHIEDRGLQLGDSIYEYFGISDGLMLDEEGHLDRLERSLREIQMAMPMPRQALQFVLREAIRRNAVRHGGIYLQITRGTVRRDHPIPMQSPRPTLILTARSADRAAIAKRKQNGIGVITLADQRWGRRDIKSTNLLPNVLAKTEARSRGAYEAWLLDSDGYVTEGASTTAWIVDKDGQLITRDLSNAILPGVTRKVVMAAAEEAQIRIVERRFTPAEAAGAAEAFLTAASAGPLPIVTVDGKPIGKGKPGPVTRRIQELYEAASRTAARR